MATSLFAVVRGFGFQVLYSPDNAIYIQLDPYFQEQVLGLCGNYDGNIQNDFESPDGVD